MALQIDDLRKLCTDDTIIMTAKEIEKLSKQAEKIISEVMIIDYNKAA